MQLKVILTIEIILHATEDITKIQKSLLDIFNINLEDYEREEMTGHFGNPIIVLKARISKIIQRK